MQNLAIKCHVCGKEVLIPINPAISLSQNPIPYAPESSCEETCFLNNYGFFSVCDNCFKQVQARHDGIKWELDLAKWKLQMISNMLNKVGCNIGTGQRERLLDVINRKAQPRD